MYILVTVRFAQNRSVLFLERKDIATRIDFDSSAEEDANDTDSSRKKKKKKKDLPKNKSKNKLVQH